MYDKHNSVIWSSNSAQTTNLKSTHLAIQSDCNLVVYHNNKAVWSTNTWGADQKPVLLQMDVINDLCLALDTVKKYGKILKIDHN